MRSNPTTEALMKTRFLSGWKTRTHALLLAALCGMAAITAAPAFAQDPAAPAEPPPDDCT